VIGHAITRGDAVAGEYNWILSPSALNQLRFGYSRRDLNQRRFKTAESQYRAFRRIRSVLFSPSSRSPDSSKIGPTTAANSNFTTSITELLDTFTLLRGRHTTSWEPTFGAKP